MKSAPLALALLVGLTACRSRDGQVAPSPVPVPVPVPVPAVDLPLTRAPYTSVNANFKERLEQPYIYFEHRGSYVETMRALPQLAQIAKDSGIELAGPPFGLYYDDPGQVAAAELRSRVCLPIDAGSVDQANQAAAKAVRLDLLPQATVVYAFAAGAYPEAPRVLPGLLKYMRSMRWVEAGPVREVYLVQPGPQTPMESLVCEVQVPVQGGQ